MSNAGERCRSTTVVVVGGGIVGASTALFLARKNIPVVLCEKGVLGGEQSGSNWGWCRTQGRDPREIPLALDSLQRWRGLNQLIGGETGFRQCGTILLCPTDVELAPYITWLAKVRDSGIDARIVAGRDLTSLVPGAAKSWSGGVYAASDGRAEPLLAAPAIAAAAQRAGATIYSGCAVRGIETAGGRVCGVITEHGSITCEQVVIAGGVWTSLLCRTLGIRFPQLKVRESLCHTVPLSGGPEVSAKEVGFAFRKRLDGGYTIAGGGTTTADIGPDHLRYFPDFLPILKASFSATKYRIGKQSLDELVMPSRWRLDAPSPFEKYRVLAPKPSQSALRRTRANLDAAFPIFRGVEVAKQWGGYIDVTPDTVPVLSPVPAVPGVFIGSGFSGHGFGLGPASGALLADLVTGDRPAVDATPFHLSRLSSVLPLLLGPL